MAWHRTYETITWGSHRGDRAWRLYKLSGEARQDWADLYDRQEGRRAQLARDGRGVGGLGGRLRRWRESGTIRELAGVVRGSQAVLGRWDAELEQQHRGERVQLAQRHYQAARSIELSVAEAYRAAAASTGRAAERAAAGGHPDDRPGRRQSAIYKEELGKQVEERLDQVRGTPAEGVYLKQLDDYTRSQVAQWKAEEAERQRRAAAARRSPSRPPERGPERGGGFER